MNFWASSAEQVPFWDTSVWQFLIQFFIISLFVIIGNTLRKKIGFVRKSLIPTSVIAGLLILIIKSVWPWFNDMIDETFMSNLTYHFLALGFIAISLKVNKDKEKSNTATVFKTGIVTVNGYLIQGILGCLLTILVVQLFKNPNLIPAAGLILPMGFGQGPGQAYNWGKIYEEKGLTGGASFGLTIAAIGFLVACLVGVIYLAILRKKNKIVLKEHGENTKEELVSVEGEVPLSESIDKLTLQIVLILFTYFVTFMFMYGIDYLCGTEANPGVLGKFGYNTLKALVWGFNFLFGTLFAVLIRTILSKFKKAKIMKYNYFSNYLLNRLSALCFDIMIVAGIAAIDLNAIASLWPTIIALAILGTAGTFIYLRIVSKNLWKGYEVQGLISMFGMLTGTASTGMLLLREVDNEFETPAADNLVYQSLPAMLFGFPMLLLLPIAVNGLKESLITVGLCILLFVIYNMIIFSNKIFNKKDRTRLNKE